MNRQLLDYLLARLKEPSSVRGLIWLTSACGLFAKNGPTAVDSTEGIIALAMLVAGLVGILTKDKHTIVEHAGTVEKAETVEQANTVIGSDVTNQTTIRS